MRKSAAEDILDYLYTRGRVPVTQLMLDLSHWRRYTLRKNLERLRQYGFVKIEVIDGVEYVRLVR